MKIIKTLLFTITTLLLAAAAAKYWRPYYFGSHRRGYPINVE
ncbi:MAG: hypothetical protein WBB69_11305 [Anaerolineales bacterium]